AQVLDFVALLHLEHKGEVGVDGRREAPPSVIVEGAGRGVRVDSSPEQDLARSDVAQARDATLIEEPWFDGAAALERVPQHIGRNRVRPRLRAIALCLDEPVDGCRRVEHQPAKAANVGEPDHRATCDPEAGPGTSRCLVAVHELARHLEVAEEHERSLGRVELEPQQLGPTCDRTQRGTLESGEGGVWIGDGRTGRVDDHLLVHDCDLLYRAPHPPTLQVTTRHLYFWQLWHRVYPASAAPWCTVQSPVAPSKSQVSPS